MFNTSSSSLAQNQIPQIRELQEKLGFDGRDGRTPAELRDATHHFRKEYLASDGTPGRDLKDWKTLRTQTELLRMARTFLEDERYGTKFWSASANSSSELGLEYPKDSDKLAELLQQLFWRQNKYSASNAKNPDRNRHVRESVESDSSSATVQPNRDFPVRRQGFVPLSDQDLQRLPSRVGTDDTRSPGASEEALNSSGLPSFRCEPTETVGQRESRLSTTQTRWALSSQHPAASIEQLPNTSTNAESSDELEFPEDIIADFDNRRRLVRQSSGPDEIQGSIEATTDQNEGDRITQTVEPRHRGVAPEAKMLEARQDPITPTSRTRTSTESKKAKRKDAEDADSEYTPSKKLRWNEGISNIASTKRRRRRTGNADDSGVQLPSGLTANQLTPPSTTITTSITGTDCNFSSQPAAFSELGQPSTPESRNMSVENSPSMPRRTPQLDKQREMRRQGKPRSEFMDVGRGHRQTVLNFSPTSNAVENRPQNGGSPYMGPSETRPRDVADETSLSSEPDLSTVTQAAADDLDDALNIAANILEHDSVRSQTSRGTGLATPEPAQDDPHPQIPDIAIDIRYSIIASRTPRLVKRNWPIQSLSGNTVKNLFEEVSKFTSKPDIQRIIFTLNLSQADSEYTIHKDNHRTFEIMKDDFADDIMADWKENGSTKFSIWLEPDPTEAAYQMSAGASGVFNVDEGRPRITI